MTAENVPEISDRTGEPHACVYLSAALNATCRLSGDSAQAGGRGIGYVSGRCDEDDHHLRRGGAAAGGRKGATATRNGRLKGDPSPETSRLPPPRGAVCHGSPVVSRTTMVVRAHRAP